MKPEVTNCRPQIGKRRSESGFSLVTAIFLLVVLAGLGAAMVTFFTTQQQSLAKDVLGSRAYQAARVGLEWAVYEIEQTPQTVPATLWAACPGALATVANFPTGNLAGTLAPFNVVVRCSSLPFTEGAAGPTIYIYDITSTATGVNGAAAGSADYVERVMTIRMGR